MNTKFISIRDAYGKEYIINVSYIVVVGEGQLGAYVKLTDDSIIELTESVSDFNKKLANG
ncbi:hypothetical protein [Chryseobacterium gambrini]|uniref:Uncharacterized protein n=1 Tax=Chryseobacterium gambrini TaxID=373672 RepID=A0ABN7CBZ5_9FLAO|nr:hypothetical protein CRDW_12760 [Chryseobacterium gambrini]